MWFRRANDSMYMSYPENKSSLTETKSKKKPLLFNSKPTFVAVFVAAGGAEVNGLVHVPVQEAAEMASYEPKILESSTTQSLSKKKQDQGALIYLGFIAKMQVLDLMRLSVLVDVEAVGQNHVRLSVQEVLGLQSSDIRDCGEDLRKIS